MKRIILLIAIIFTGINISAQKEKLNELFERYQDAKGVTSIKIAKPMFSMLNKLNLDDAELNQIKPLLSKINGLKILIFEKPEIKDSLSAESKKMMTSFNNLTSEVTGAVKKLNYEELVTINSDGNKVRFLSSDATNGILDNLLLSVTSSENNILMMLDGKLSMDDVNNLINEGNKVAKTPKN